MDDKARAEIDENVAENSSRLRAQEAYVVGMTEIIDHECRIEG